MKMLDSRFPVRPSVVKVPLYPNIDITYQARHLPQEPIANYFQRVINCKKIHFANSATEALISWLRAKFSGKLRISLPSFFCPDVAFNLHLEGHDLILYDIGYNDLLISDNDINNLIGQHIDIFIIPSFFGYRNNIKHKIDLLRKRGDMHIVVDLAQAFPLENLSYLYNDRTALLFSFGKSKALASAGGGALIPPKNCKVVLDLEQEQLKNSTINYCNITDQSKKQSKLESDLKTLLAKKFYCAPQSYPLKICALPINASEQININYNRYLNFNNTLYERYKRIQTIINNSGGSNFLKFCKEINGMPIILALNIENNMRYKFSAFLANYGIETTWYYYPLHLQPLYQKKINKFNNKFSSTESIASNILVVPFSLNQSNQEFNILAKALEELL